jgi:hypothetical protein
MSQKMDIHGYQLEFEKNEGKAIIEIFIDEEGQECYLIDIFSVNDRDYIALVPVDNDELYIFIYDVDEDDDENINLIAIEDEEEMDLIYHLFSHFWDEEAIDAVIDDYNSDMDFVDVEDEE